MSSKPSSQSSHTFWFLYRVQKVSRIFWLFFDLCVKEKKIILLRQVHCKIFRLYIYVKLSLRRYYDDDDENVAVNSYKIFVLFSGTELYTHTQVKIEQFLPVQSCAYITSGGGAISVSQCLVGGRAGGRVAREFHCTQIQLKKTRNTYLTLRLGNTHTVSINKRTKRCVNLLSV